MNQRVKSILKTSSFYVFFIINIAMMIYLLGDLYFYLTDPQYRLESQCYGADCKNTDPNDWIEIMIVLLKIVGVFGLSAYIGWRIRKKHFMWALLFETWWIIVVVVGGILIEIGVIDYNI